METTLRACAPGQGSQQLAWETLGTRVPLRSLANNLKNIYFTENTWRSRLIPINSGFVFFTSTPHPFRHDLK